MTKASREYRVNVLDKAVLILRAFSSAEPKLSLSEISQLTGVHVSTCFRLLATLRHHGLVMREASSGGYRLGYEIIALAETARSGDSLVDSAVPVMREIAMQFDETVILSVRSGADRIDLEQVVCAQSVRRVVSLGVPKPLYAGAASRVLLPGLGEAELAEYLDAVPLEPLAEQTITDADTLREALGEIRRNGFAVSLQEQSGHGGAGVAAPVLGARRDIVGALGVSIPQFRFNPALRSQLIPAVRAAADRISRAIGGAGHETA